MAILSVGNRGRVNGSNVNIRTGPGTNNSRLYYAQAGDIVVVLGGSYDSANAWWLQIRNETRNTTTVGWIHNDYVDPYSTGGGTGSWETRWTNTPGETVNIRNGPGTNYTIVNQYPHGTKVQVNAPSSTWSSVRLYGGTTVAGYVMTSFLVASDPNGGTGSWETRWTNTPGETVNIRNGPGTNYTIVNQYPHGTKVQVNAPSSTWSQVRRYGNTTVVGYMMTDFLLMADPNGGSGGGGNTGGSGIYNTLVMVETDRFGNGGTVTLRSQQSTSSGEVTTIASGTDIYVSTLNGEWLPAKHGNYTGYVMAKFIFGSAAYNQQPSGVSGTITYDREAAVDYATQHALEYNDQYEAIANNDCANFVSQCLYAGGMYMNGTWNYQQPGNYSSRTQAWTGTVSLRNMLTEERRWAYRVYDRAQLQKGDLVFTYESDSSLPHVVIVSEDVVPSTGTIKVCGHTADQLNVNRPESTNSRYYHIVDTQWIKTTDWRY